MEMDQLLRLFRSILGTALLTTIDTESIERATDDVITDTWKILHSTTTDQNNGVLLEVMPLTTDVGDDFISVSEANLSNLTKRRVGLLRCASVNLKTNAAALRAVIQSR